MRIESESDAKRIRRERRLCYLCGRPLPRNGRRSSRFVSREHVIPKCVSGEAPAESKDAWLLILDVHKHCEEAYKASMDELLGMIQKIHEVDPAEVPKNHIGRLSRSVERVDTASGESEIGIRAEAFIKGAWTWIRGLHYALYDEYISDQVRHRLYPPVPEFNTHSRSGLQEQICQSSRRAATIYNILDRSEERGKWDGVIAWGHRIRYRCVWIDRGDLGQELARKQGRFMCAWALDIPGARRWSSSLVPSPRSWHGVYERPRVPDGALVLDKNDLERNVWSLGL